MMAKLISKYTWGKRKETVLRKGSWLTHHVKVVNINTVFEKHDSSENIYILLLCCRWWSIVNLFWNRWTNWSYSKSSLPEISKLNDSALDEKQEEQTKYSPN